MKKNDNGKKEISIFLTLDEWRHDIQHNDTHHNDTQHNRLICDTRHK
jgi:hypothetical protein